MAFVLSTNVQGYFFGPWSTAWFKRLILILVGLGLVWFRFKSKEVTIPVLSYLNLSYLKFEWIRNLKHLVDG